MALTALSWDIRIGKTGWILDVDIRTFFDRISHEWLMRMVAHRITDSRILRLIERWLKAGVLESGRWQKGEIGTPQGSGISPVLANVFLHYIFDLWFQHRRRHAKGEMIAARYADDLVLGFQYENEARQMLADLKKRFGDFGLTLNEEKTRLIRFGRFAAPDRLRAGWRRPETFNFLGFTHYCGKQRDGKFTVKRTTQAKRLTGKLKELRVEMKRRIHIPVSEQCIWLSQVLRGHYGYYGVISNSRALNAFYWGVRTAGFKALCRRRQQSYLSVERFNRLPQVIALPRPIIHQQWSTARA